MDALVAEQSALVGWLTLFAVAFATLALGLAAIGLHGTVSFLAARRTREIGIRMALGATPRDVVRLVAGQGLWSAAAGGLAGAALGLGVSRVLAFVLLDATPPATTAVASALAVMAVVQWSATWWPVRRAVALDPSSALRED
jgi:ABC-type antimicrobial peptide transport system permease subunit